MIQIFEYRQSQKYLQKSQLLDIMQATQPQKSCHALQPQNMDTDDKLVLSPIVFQGMYNFYLIFIFVKSKLSTRTEFALQVIRMINKCYKICQLRVASE